MGALVHVRGLPSACSFGLNPKNVSFGASSWDRGKILLRDGLFLGGFLLLGHGQCLDPFGFFFFFVDQVGLITKPSQPLGDDADSKNISC